MKNMYIFCDASIDLKTKVACSGTIVVNADSIGQDPIRNYITDGIFVIQENATNNSGEIMAIRKAVEYAIHYQTINKLNPEQLIINIFSDSKISLFGLREWCFNWENNQNEHGILYGSGNNPVSNQEEFKNIIRMISDLSLYAKIRFFHQRGHVKIKDYLNTSQIREFCEWNYLHGLTELGLSYPQICAANDIADTVSRYMIGEYLSVKKLSPKMHPRNIAELTNAILDHDDGIPKTVLYDIDSPVRWNINKRYMQLYKEHLADGTYNGGKP